MIAVRVVIVGRVQGVGYRAWAVDEAETRGLTGWVRNRRDGTVEAVFHGPEALVNAMVEACRNGPRLAHVTVVDTYAAANESWPDFSIRPAE